MTQATEPPVPNRRRNGKPPSCEPCRLSKLSCDHVMPICGRCSKRKVPERCTYHPAPMTGLRRKETGTQVTSSSNSPENRSSPSLKRKVSQINGNSDGKQSLQLPAPGFLGSTSYSAVYTENGHELDEETDDTGDGPNRLQRSLVTPHNQRNVEEGLVSLRHLQNFPQLEAIAIGWREQACDSTLMSAHLLRCIKSIRDDLYTPLANKGSEEDLRAVARRLFDGFSRQIKIPPGCKFLEYPDQFTGKNIRWETLGLFFTAVGLGVMQLSVSDPLLAFVGNSQEGKQSLSRQMLDASDACICFCDDAGHLNDPSIWLLTENTLLMSQVLGDTNYLTWRRLGDLSTGVFALGLHQEIKLSADIPFWLVEFRRKALAVAYSVDKTICTFVGRPPRISKRYCAIEPPLDLDFKALSLDDDELQQQVSRLDAAGWNRTDRHPNASKPNHVRAILFTSLIREEILELSLGPYQDNIYEVAADIARRNKEVWEDFPENIQFYPEIWSSDRPREDCIQITITYLDIMYNDFMLQRMLVRRIRARTDEVIRVSRLLLTTLIDMISNHGRSSSLHNDDPWLIVLYGLPAAGVLALELLQQTHLQSKQPSRSSDSSGFPRSEIIQSLSVLVSYLGWIHVEGDGNYHLSVQARRMLQRILDRVLSPPPPPKRSKPQVLPGNTKQQSLDSPSYNPNYAQSRLAPDEQNSHPNSNVFDPAQYSSALPTPPTPSTAFTPNSFDPLDLSWMDNWNTEFDADFWMNLPDHPLLASDRPNGMT